MTRAVWFARLGDRSGSGTRMTPVSREGWFVVIGFAAAMAIGAVIFAALMARGAIALGALVYAAIGIVAGGLYIWASLAHGDKTKTALDYRAMREKGAP